MMILSPAIVLKEASPCRRRGRHLLVGALLVLAGLGVLSATAARPDGWD
jgi:hypothetical protein